MRRDYHQPPIHDLPKLAAQIKCHITAEMFRKHRSEEMEENIHQDINSSKIFLKKASILDSCK